MNASETVVITLPIPDPKLSPNGRAHWRQKSRLVQAHRAEGKLRTWKAMGLAPFGEWERASILVRWFGRHHNCLRLDQTNIIGSLKPYEDGIVDAGLLKNDRGVCWLPPERAVDKANPRIEMVVTRMEAA